MLMGIISMQLILPLLVCIAILIVKDRQKEIVAQGITTRTEYKVITLDEVDARNIMSGEGEMQYEGELYDIERITTHAGVTTVTMIADKEETRLQSIAGGSSENSTGGSSQKILPFFFLYHQHMSPWSVFANYSPSLPSSSKNYEVHSGYDGLNDPPPRHLTMSKA